MIWALIATLLTVGISLYLILTLLATLGGLTSFPFSIPLGTSINLGQWAKPELVDLGASIIGTIVLILLFLFFRRWIRYSALSVNWKYIRSLGWRRIAKDTWTALFQDSLLLSSVQKRSKKRWFVHGLVLYGFIFMLLATTLAAFFNYSNAPHGFWWPPRIIGNLGGLSSLIGLSIMGWRLVRDPYEDNGKTYVADIAFVFLLFLTILTGFATEFIMYGLNATLAYGSFLLHMLLVSGLFLALPYTRFNHVLLTPFLLILTRLNQTLVEENNVPGILDEPAPGRHYKTERLAVDCQKQIFPKNEESTVTLRYYP
ncbi:MAG TPA: hypothetical protein VMV58_05245 [Desulfosporosinus sp.]|nr:hypothetical protein [Desulfosporosinus sp.]